MVHPGVFVTDRFFIELKQKVSARLATEGRTPYGGAPMVLKALALLTYWAACYALWIWAGSHGAVWAFVGLLPLMGAMVLYQLGVFHDASHGALSRHAWVNRIAQLSLNVAGASTISWHHEHVVRHHGQTNIPGHDTDLDSGGFLRFHPAQERKWVHRFQHLYAWPLYGVVMLRWAWFEDFDDLVRNSYHLAPKARAMHVFEVLLSRVLHSGLYIAAPAVVFGVWKALMLYAALYITIGIVVSGIFVLAHVSSVQAFPKTREDLPRDWARFQLATTANFATQHGWLTWAIGGLNHQVEHHLFPTLSHRNFGVVQEVVRAHCAQNGVPYLEFPSVWAALKSHYLHLRNLGQA